MDRTKLAAAIAAVVLQGSIVAAEEAQPPAGHEAHRHDGAITMTKGGETTATTVLGAHLGSDRVEGVKVDLYALQATAPERLAPGGSGPTHVFNATFVEETESRLLAGAAGTIVVDGPGGERRVPIVPFAKHFQGLVRLDEPGAYRIRVEFDAEGHAGTTRPFAFHYERKGTDAEPAHAGHDHGGHAP